MQVSIGNLLATMLMAFGPTVTSAMESVTNAVKEISKQGTILNTVFKAFIAFGLAALVVDLALKFGVFVDAVIKAIAAVRALGMTALIAKAFVSPEAAIASAVAAAGLAVGAALIFDQIMKGIKPIEVQATGGTAAGKAGNLLPPAMKDIGGAADTAAKAGKSTEGKGGGLINTMVDIAAYAARMQAAFVDMAKSMEGHLFEIAKNTGSTRDLLDLRKQTFGGGRLGAIGVTASELNAGNNATNQGGVGIIPQTLIPASTDLERAMRKMMIQQGRQNLVTEMRRI